MNVVNLIASRSSQLGSAAAEIAGMVHDMAAQADGQHTAFTAVNAKVDALKRANHEIVNAAQSTAHEAEKMKHAVDTSLAKAQTLESSVHAAQEAIQAINQTFRQVSSVAGDISKIALQTKLLSFNASVEAHRAGAEGRGFAVVAASIRDLAGAVETASRQITDTIRTFGDRIQALEATMSKTGGEGGHDSVIQEAVRVFHDSFSAVDARVRAIRAGAASNDTVCHDVHAQVAQLTQGVQQASAALKNADRSVEVLLSMAEEMIGIVADSGEETVDTPYIDAVIDGAARIARAIEASIARGDADKATWFDTQYRPLAGTDPQQFETRYCRLSDRLFAEVQESMLDMPGVVFCAAVDKNGFLPTHNRKYSQPQRASDPAWNAANCRNRRLFNDRTGLSAGRNMQRFLLQTYRRDMGNGQYVLMKDLSAPIVVNGQHWGGLRLGYRLES